MSTASAADQKLIAGIESLRLSERLKRMREKYFSEGPRACSERLQFAVESWKQTDGEHIELRKAKQLERILEGIPVVIHDEELTVGSHTRFFRGAYPIIDWDAEYFKHPEVHVRRREGDDVTFGSPGLRGSISEDDLQACEEAVAYFKGKTPAELVRQSLRNIWGSWYEDAMEVKAVAPRYESFPPVPSVPKWEVLLQKGLRGIIQEAQAQLQRFSEMMEDDPEKLHFWQAVIIVCEATIQFTKRYAKLARELALKTADATRRAELEEIARICERVPENPPRTFHEAVQAVRLTHLALLLEDSRHGASLGRVDQYLYPYFKKDIQEGRLTLEKAADLIGELITYMARLEEITEFGFKEVAQTTQITHIVLGGVTKEGEDATNELTYLSLHMVGLLRYAEPHTSIRWFTKTPRWLLMKGLQVNRTVAGNPMYVNDDHIVWRLVEWGVPIEMARDYAIQGCSQPVSDPGGYIKPMTINVPLALDLALHNGISPITGKRICPETGDPRTFKSFEEVYGAFKKQYEFYVRRLLRAQRLIHRLETERWRIPLHSALHFGCLENGRSHLVGGNGGSYPIWYQKDRGMVDVADSLMAIKKLVFDEKRLTMAELIEALDCNFEGKRGEQIRRMCLSAPKYGNAIDEADEMVRDLAKFSASVIRSEKNAFGWPYAVNRNGLAWHYAAGKGVSALPNGRKFGEPLTDGSLSPMRGVDTKGPTVLLGSALKADYRDVAVAILNQKFPAAVVQSAENLEKVAQLTETFLRNGGLHIQYNFLDKNVLLEAKKHPEQYKDLIVRVAGYSAYFVNLTPEVQDDIIRRTEQWL